MTTNTEDYALAPAAIRRTAAGFRASQTVPPHGLIRAALNLEQATNLIFHFRGAGDVVSYLDRAEQLRRFAANARVWSDVVVVKEYLDETASLLDAAADRLEQALHITPTLSR